MADIKLYYFDLRARAELARLVLAAGGQKFEDIRWAEEDWPKYKPEAPFGQAPFMEYNGKKYGQSVAIANFFAREFGLYGETNLDALRIDEVMCLTQDIWQTLLKAWLEKDEAKKAEMDKKNQSEELPKFFGFFNKMLAENKPNGVIVGKDLTLADICVYDIMYSLCHAKSYDAGASFPDLKALKDKVEAHPKIKDYLAQRKVTEF